MIKQRLYYDFKTVPETTWVAVIGALTAVAGYFLPLFGLNGADTVTAVGVVGVISRIVIGALRGTYNFREAWEVAWAGIQAASAIIAAVIASTTDANTVSIGGIVALASILPRPIFAAMLGVATKQTAGDLPPPAPFSHAPSR